MKRLFHKEEGQSFVLVAILIVALIGMLALVIDGGFSYANRRSAQNAADAGALAGVQVLCKYRSGVDDPVVTVNNAESLAEQYATVNNDATGAVAVADLGERAIDVTASISYSTFFAGMLGQDVITATAEASAVCGRPCEAQSVLPVAWSCAPPITNTLGISGTIPGWEDCTIGYGTMDTVGPLYMIMDSDKIEEDFICKDPDPESENYGEPVDGLDCDLDGDGENDAITGGQRSWLDLDGGGGGASELTSWITSGYPGSLAIHSWRSGESGATTSVYSAAAARVGDVVLIPVFNQYCKGDPSDTESLCYDELWHDGLDSIELGTSQYYFHIINYSAFRITCVDAPPKPVPNPVPPEKYCPGKQMFLDQNPTLSPSIGNTLNSIEGYFIHDYIPTATGNCGPMDDSGIYTIYLK